MATEKLIAGSGVGLTWTNAHTTGFNSMGTGKYYPSDVVIDNSVALDMFCDFSFVATWGSALSANALIEVFIPPLNADGTTYGDNTAGGFLATNTTPNPYYHAGPGRIELPAGTAVSFVIRQIVIPPGKFIFAMYNVTGVNGPASVTAQYRTYNRSVA